MSIFDEVISFESLYNAHRKARLGKRHKKEVIEFEMNLSENLWKIHYELKYQKYRVGEYHKFMIYDPKEREIQAISYRDRIVQHALCDVFLSPFLNNRLIFDNAACRKNKGTHFAINRLREFMTSYYRKHGKSGCFIKVDVKKYFDSINHDLLKELLAKNIKDERILKLLFVIIDSYNVDTNKGLPMGNQTSQCFALYFLDVVDRLIKEKLRCKYYVRYMDDMILIVPNKVVASQWLNEIRKQIENISLQVNTKSQIIPVKNGVRFLGWHFRFGKNGRIIQTVCNDSLKRMKSKFKEKTKLLQLGRIPKEHWEMTQNSFKAHLKHGNTEKISKFFNVVQCV